MVVSSILSEWVEFQRSTRCAAALVPLARTHIVMESARAGVARMDEAISKAASAPQVVRVVMNFLRGWILWRLLLWGQSVTPLVRKVRRRVRKAFPKLIVIPSLTASKGRSARRPRDMPTVIERAQCKLCARIVRTIADGVRRGGDSLAGLPTQAAIVVERFGDSADADIGCARDVADGRVRARACSHRSTQPTGPSDFSVMP